jgi:hypothetical protein
VIDLIKAYERGLIPGPHENDASFLERVEAISESKFSNLSPLTDELFGFSIDWVPVVSSNKNLLPWEGAAIWISQGAIPQIQLREHCLKTKLFLRDSDEFLAHEAVHAARMSFEEPQFEEILAYQTSKKCFRKFWGPLFRSSKESSLFGAVFGVSLICGWVLPGPFWLLSLSLSGYFIFRLVHSQRIFAKCLKKTSLPFMLCLTDKEIRLFSQLGEEEIMPYLEKQQGLRHHLLNLLVFAKKGKKELKSLVGSNPKEKKNEKHLC